MWNLESYCRIRNKGSFSVLQSMSDWFLGEIDASRVCRANLSRVELSLGYCLILRNGYAAHLDERKMRSLASSVSRDICVKMVIKPAEGSS